ncbi:Fungalysin/Thermolysin Extracellular metalloproteinase 5 [Allomyces arbusculus]|nr:Fungalysin/Thermolysin Extracellular metalloproteinase 5 [Allomyces arbusculus]
MTTSPRAFTILFLLALIAVQAITVVDAKRLIKVPAIAHSTFSTQVPPVNSLLPTSTDAKTAATAFLTTQMQFPATDFVVKDVVPTSSGVTAVYARQIVNGLEVVNGDININVKDGKIISYGDRFYRGARPAKPPVGSQESLIATGKSPADAFQSFATYIGAKPAKVDVKPVPPREGAGPDAPKEYTIDTDIAEQPVPVKYAYVQDGNNLKLVYSYQVKQANNWYHAHVNAQSGAVEAVNDWVADASARYSVLPIGTENPEKGPIEIVDGSTAVKSNASPQGWHADASQSFTDTRGNNILAQPNTKAGNTKRPDGGSALDFTAYKPDFSKPAEQYTDAATVQLFYMLNTAHDLSYQYGFDEVSGNFQTSNFNKGGKGNDPVQAYAQDRSGTDNANFATPPDGQKPTTRQFIFTQTKPTRDGVYDLTIPFHEYMHGITNRLTGGPSNTDCLWGGESGGMGEGWGDVFGMVANTFKADSDRNAAWGLGAYVLGNTAGIRTYPYSSNTQTCPNLYSYLSKPDYDEVHMAGEIWASMLIEVYFNFVDELGYGDLFSASTSKGNSLFLRILFDALKIQPCNPTFVEARDALISAEQQLTKGAYKCLIWKGFAKRGLGSKAVKAKYVDSFDLPAECSGPSSSTSTTGTKTTTTTKTSTATATATTTTKPTPTATTTKTSTRTSTRTTTTTSRPEPTPCPWWDPWCNGDDDDDDE